MPNDHHRSKVLLVQTNLSDAEIIRKALLDSSDVTFDIEWVKSRSEALARLATAEKLELENIAALLVDLYLSDSEGLETFDVLYRAAPHIPILVLISSQQDAPPPRERSRSECFI